MENQLASLEGKVEQLLRLVEKLRQEQREQVQHSIEQAAEISELRSRLGAARERIEGLVSRLPDMEDAS